MVYFQAVRLCTKTIVLMVYWTGGDQQGKSDRKAMEMGQDIKSDSNCRYIYRT